MDEDSDNEIEMVDMSMFAGDRPILTNIGTSKGDSITKMRNTVFKYFISFLDYSSMPKFVDLIDAEVNGCTIGQFSSFLLLIVKLPKMNSHLSYLSELTEILKDTGRFPSLLLGENMRMIEKVRDSVRRIYKNKAEDTGTFLIDSSDPVTDEDLAFICEILFMSYAGKNATQMYDYRAVLNLDRQLAGRISETFKTRLSALFMNTRTKRLTVKKLICISTYRINYYHIETTGGYSSNEK